MSGWLTHLTDNFRAKPHVQTYKKLGLGWLRAYLHWEIQGRREQITHKTMLGHTIEIAEH